VRGSSTVRLAADGCGSGLDVSWITRAGSRVRVGLACA